MIKFAVKDPPKLFLYYIGRNYNIPYKHTVRLLNPPRDDPEDSGVWKGERLMLENVYSSPILGNISFSLESGNVYSEKEQIAGNFIANNILHLGSEESYVSGTLSISMSHDEAEPVFMDEFIVLIHLRGNMYKKTREIVERNIEERNNQNHEF